MVAEQRLKNILKRRSASGLLLFFIFVTACGNPLGGSQSSVGNGSDSGVAPGATPSKAVPSASLSSVIASSASSTADGVASVMVTVTLLDASGKAVYGDPVFLNSSRGVLDMISPSFAISSSAGVATFTVKSLYAGTAVFSAQETLNNISLTQTAGVTFSGGANAVSGSQSSVGASLTSVIDNGTSSSKILVILSDLSGNPVPGKTVSLSSSRGVLDSIGPASGVSNSSGLVTFTVTSTTAGTSVYTATDVSDSIAILPSVATVNFIPGPASTITIISGNGQSATVNSVLTNPIVVKVTDSTNNVITGAAVNWAIVAGAGSLSASSSTTNSSGLTQVTWTVGTVASANSVSATINGTSTSVSFASTGTAGAVTHLGVSGFANPATAGTSYPFTISALDVYNNIVPGYSGTVAISSSDASATLPGNSTLVSGTKSFNATLNKVNGAQTITAIDTVTSGYTGTQSGIAVLPSAATPTQIQLSGSSSFATGACTALTLTVQNSTGVTTNMPWNLNLNLSGSFGNFYSDTCTTLITSTSIPTGQSSKVIYYRNYISETAVVLQVKDAVSVLVSGLFSVTTSAATPVSLLSGAVANNTCVIMSSGGLWCSGSNMNGFMGNVGLNIMSPMPFPVQNLLGSVVSASINGWYNNAHGCAVLSTGSVQCWGSNQYGDLGNNSNVDSSLPVTVSGITTATAVAAGGSHACALLSGGTIKCWGYNGGGQLGNNSLLDSWVPVNVSGIATATAIWAASGHSCALLSGGTVQCWGSNGSGQLGNNSTTTAVVPVAVSGITTAIAVSLGANHSCALLSGGTVQCWGHNGNGQLGNNSVIDSHIPVSVSGITTATAIASGGIHTCALLSSGVVKCWGYNGNGQLGNNSVIDSHIPVSVSGIGTAMSIVAGYMHTCAKSSTGSPIQCWGYGEDGQLGAGTVKNTSVPVAMLGFSAGAVAKLFLLDGEQAMNYSAGNQSTPNSCTPIVVAGANSTNSLASSFVVDTTINLSVSGDPGIRFYSDSACSIQKNSLLIPAGAVAGKAYFNNPAFNDNSGCSTAPAATLSAQSQDGTLTTVAPLNVDFAVSGGCGC